MITHQHARMFAETTAIPATVIQRRQSGRTRLSFHSQTIQVRAKAACAR